MTRGEVYFALLAPRSGSTQCGRRPVVVMSSDSFNRVEGWRSVMVVPLSSSEAQRRRGPTGIPVPAGEGGLTKASVAVCHQLTTLDRTKLERRLGHLPDARVRLIGLGIMAALDLI